MGSPPSGDDANDNDHALYGAFSIIIGALMGFTTLSRGLWPDCTE